MPRLAFIRPWQVVSILSILYIILVLGVNNYNPLSLVTIGTVFSEGIPEAEGGIEGYDGQFVYFISRDPATAAQYIDVPAYRFQRIVLPALGWAFSFGQEALIPWVLLLVNLIALGGSTAILEHLLQEKGYSRWYALTYGLSVGIFVSVRLSLTEPLAYGLAIAGIALFHHKKLYWSAAVFALAMLTKETVVFFPMGYTLYLFYQKRWTEGFTFGAISITPFILWQLVLFQHFGTFGIGSGGAKSTSFELIPFAGFWKTFALYPAENRIQIAFIYILFYTPLLFIPTLYSLVRVAIDVRNKTLSSFSFLLFFNALIMLFIPISTYGLFIAIMRFAIGLQITVILYTAHHKQTRALRYSTLWLLTAPWIITTITAFPVV